MSSTCGLSLDSLKGLDRTRFLDRNGQFAKRWKFVSVVRLTFDDGRIANLTKKDYGALPTPLREFIKTRDS